MTQDKSGPVDNGFYEDQLTIGNAAALENIQKDRCLLRRQTRLVQNGRFKLGKEDKEKASEEMCEDGEMQVSIDRSTKEIHNHFGKGGPHPHPHPHPHPPRRMPWWLLALLLALIIIVLFVAWLVWYLDRPVNPIGWQLDIDAENPEVVEPADNQALNGVSGIDRMRERESTGETQ